MNLLVPCAGRSSRYDTARPKYLLAMPDNRLMFEHAAAPVLAGAERVLFAVLREHDEAFEAGRIIQELLPGSEVLVLDEVTRGQAETVLAMLRHFNVQGSFLVKDSDSHFVPLETYDPGRNYVSLVNARETDSVKLYNKSFAVINEQGYIVGTVEKSIASDFFSCGGYYFADAAQFVQSFQEYDRLQFGGEFFLSQIIDHMIERGHLFHPMLCRAYEDWGTHEDWIAYRQRFSTYLFDLDGVIYQNGSPYWHPRWGENDIFPAVAQRINELHEQGNYILIVTSRPEKYRAVTEEQLRRDGLKYHQLVMGVHHGRRVLVNDFGKTNPYPSAVAINTQRDSADFIDKL